MVDLADAVGDHDVSILRQVHPAVRDANKSAKRAEAAIENLSIDQILEFAKQTYPGSFQEKGDHVARHD